MRERGIIDRQKKHWLLRKPGCHWRQDALTLGLEPLFLAYACLILGVPLSLLILVLEKLQYKGCFQRMDDLVRQYVCCGRGM